MELVLCSILVFLVLQAQAQHQNPEPRIDITTSVPNSLVQPGAEFTVACRLIGIDASSLFYFKKGAFVDIVTNPISEVIATNNVVDAFYKKLNRFTVVKSTENNDLVYTLIVTNAMREDSGFYGCLTQAEDSKPAFAVAQIKVYHPPKEVTHNQNGTHMYLEDGEQIKFDCHADGISSEPDIEVWVLNRDDTESVNPLITGEDNIKPPKRQMLDRYRAAGETHRDVTKNFLISTLPKAKCTENVALKDCPLYLDYSATVNHTDRHELKAKPEYNGKFLTCVVTMRELTRDSVNASVLLHVYHAPRIICKGITTRNKIPAKLESTDFKVECNVTALPALSENAKWYYGPCHTGELLFNNEQYEVTEVIKTPDESKRELKLAFKKKLQSGDFNKKYCLTVKSSRAQVNQEFMLEQDKSGGLRIYLPSTLLSVFFVACFSWIAM